MELSYPRVKRRPDGHFYVEFVLGSKRIRLLNGQKIKLNLKPNSYPPKQRKGKAELLAREVYNYLVNNNYSFDDSLPKNEIELYDHLVKQKLNEPLSPKYKKAIESIAGEFRGEVLTRKTIPIEFTNRLIKRHQNPTSFNTTRRHINAFLNYLKENGFPVEISSLKPRKQAEQLHKPIENVALLFEEIKEFNFNLFLCCSLTYGCLLRPHREIRLLKWGDFSDDLKYVSVDGARVKSKRNRIVPVPEFIRSDITPTKKGDNIFTGAPIEFNHHYFSKLWERFKKESKLLKPDQTLYSFRHSGAIEIFKRTGSITKLQKAMGHASINVSLTYLRGLEIPELNEEDMPMI